MLAQQQLDSGTNHLWTLALILTSENVLFQSSITNKIDLVMGTSWRSTHHIPSVILEKGYAIFLETFGYHWCLIQWIISVATSIFKTAHCFNSCYVNDNLVEPAPSSLVELRGPAAPPPKKKLEVCVAFPPPRKILGIQELGSISCCGGGGVAQRALTLCPLQRFLVPSLPKFGCQCASKLIKCERFCQNLLFVLEFWFQQ